MKEPILVIDDDVLLLSTVSDLLTREGYSVTSVTSGLEAIEKVKETYYMLIVIDIRMPGLNGIETLRKIREVEEKSHVKSSVIIITGYADEMAPVYAIKLGAVDYILKPFKAEEFIYSINRSMKTVILEQEKQEYIKELKHTNEKLQDALEELEKTKAELMVTNAKLEELNKELEKKVEERTRKLKEAQNQLVQSAKMAAVGQLGVGVAHELNNPLGGVLGYAQFMLEKLKKPDFSAEDFKSCQRYIESIERESNRCKGIVENLLKFSRRPVSVNPEPIDIGKAIEDTLSITGHQLSLKNIKINLDIPPDLARITGVVSDLQQVFTNVILNAKQAMPQGGELSIIARNIKDENTGKVREIEMRFVDSGCGISKENLSRIFEPFFTTKQDWKSTGLGLSVSYEILKDHNGKIEVVSEVGKGSTFIITLPVAN